MHITARDERPRALIKSLQCPINALPYKTIEIGLEYIKLQPFKVYGMSKNPLNGTLWRDIERLRIFGEGRFQGTVYISTSAKVAFSV